MINSIPQRQRLLFIIAGAGLLLLVMDRLIFTPLTGLWQSHQKEIAALRQSVAVGDGLVARSAQLQRAWSDLQARALPPDPTQSEQELISSIDRWGRSSGVELGSIKPQWKRGTTDQSSLLECRVDATGSYANLGRFLYEVEQAPLALRVDSVELSVRDDSGRKIALALVVSGLRLAPMEARR